MKFKVFNCHLHVWFVVLYNEMQILWIVSTRIVGTDTRMSKVILESGKTETAKNSRLDVAFRMYRQHLVKIIWPAGCQWQCKYVSSFTRYSKREDFQWIAASINSTSKIVSKHSFERIALNQFYCLNNNSCLFYQIWTIDNYLDFK